MADSNNELFNEINSLNTVVGGKRLTLKGEGSKKYLGEVANFVDKKIKEIEESIDDSGVSIGREKLLILAAINITDELFKQKYFENNQDEIYDYPQIKREKERIESIIDKITDAL